MSPSRESINKSAIDGSVAAKYRNRLDGSVATAIGKKRPSEDVNLLFWMFPLQMSHKVGRRSNTISSVISFSVAQN